MSVFTGQTVVVPVDFSEAAFNAVDLAIDMAELADTVHLVHVVPEIMPYDVGEPWRRMEYEQVAKVLTEKIRERFADAKYANLQIHIDFGDPGEQIVEYARRQKAALVVLPSHGRRGLARMLIGSVAERVVRLAECPVLVLRSAGRAAKR